jgi:hypothetical protein
VVYFGAGEILCKKQVGKGLLSKIPEIPGKGLKIFRYFGLFLKI